MTSSFKGCIVEMLGDVKFRCNSIDELLQYLRGRIALEFDERQTSIYWKTYEILTNIDNDLSEREIAYFINQPIERNRFEKFNIEYSKETKFML